MTAYVTAADVFGDLTDVVPDDVLDAALTLRGLRPLSRTARLAMVAAARVLPPGSVTGARDGVVLGSARSSVAPLAAFVQVAAEHGADQVFPMAFPGTVVSVHVGYLAALLGLRGPAVAVCGEHSGLEAVVEAHALLEAGRADRVLALGADAAEDTVRAALPGAGEGAAALRLSSSPEADGCLAVVTGCWTGRSRGDLPLATDLAPSGAPEGAAAVVAAVLGVAADGRGRTVVGRSGVRGWAAVRVEAA